MIEKRKNIVRMLKWLGIAYAITLLLIVIYALVLTYTGVPESTMPMCVLGISMLSILLASSLSTKKVREKGLVNGGMIGFLYIFILYILSSIFLTGFRVNAYSIWTIALCILMGCVGGIIGVNM